MAHISEYERVLAARAKERPTARSYINNIFENFTELHGDRRYGDDKAVIGGVAFLYGFPYTVIALEKGTETSEKIERNFGSAHPEAAADEAGGKIPPARDLHRRYRGRILRN